MTLPDLGAFGKELNKRISDVENQKAAINSPDFTGAPTSTTPEKGDNSTKIATTAFVKQAVGDASIVADGVYAAFTAFAQANGI